MNPTETPPLAEFRLLPDPNGHVPLGSDALITAVPLPEDIRRKNIRWLCFLRWIVTGLIISFGIINITSNLPEMLGLHSNHRWPFALATILAIANICFLAHARMLAKETGIAKATLNLWAQIIFDLLMLTVVVHYLGSLETPVSFAYLFHIVLGCIFFSRGRAFVVTLIASVCYVVCVTLEQMQILSPAGIYADSVLRGYITQSPGLLALDMTWNILTWVAVWYLTSHLSGLVRERDFELAHKNRRLVEAREEKAKHILRTTHELKAPFAAVHANVQLLLKGYCGDISDQVKEVLLRISARCRRLATEIQEMLQLANLRAVRPETLPRIELDLADIIRHSVEQQQALAQERGVAIDVDLEPAPATAVKDHMQMLFSNLLSNAIVYSHRDGKIRIECRRAPGPGPRVIFEDNGIGIPEQKLPHIFNEYYRTDEAARHNKESTGLGLSIVRRVADTHNIRVRVESRFGAGAKFTLDFPAPQQLRENKQTGKEKDHVIPVDR